ncbi:MAG: hypothetical protein L6406_06280 [Desulfobacterales bacterium]|nr:hypothetical protein [Desulfobacterales bacterium]
MRTAFFLILSLAVAVTLCLVLVATGVLKFNGDSAAIETVLSRSRKVLDALPSAREIISQPGRQETPSALPDANQAIPEMSQASSNDGGNVQATTDREGLIYSRALDFLRTGAAKGGSDIEERFAEFLMGELDLDQKETARLVKMSFWKNFVTLQHPWRAEDKDEMRIAFAREKELKKAGFAARGLTLMENQVQEAEARLQELGQRLSDSATGGEGL